MAVSASNARVAVPANNAYGCNQSFAWQPQRPIIVVGAYIPPPGEGWGQSSIRGAIFETLEAMFNSIFQQRFVENIFPIALVHSNSPDNGCEVPLVLPPDLDLSMIDAGLAVANLERGTRPVATRFMFRILNKKICY